MHHRERNLLTVRRIAIVFECLLPQDLADDVVAFRLVDCAELAAQVCGIEILPRGELELGAQVPGARKGFWERRALRARPALPSGRGG